MSAQRARQHGTTQTTSDGMIDVLTNRYSNARTGVNGSETELTKSAISSSKFGKLFTRTVDGDLYAQPLIVSGLKIGGIKRNVVFVATSRNMVYAFDADDPLQYLPLWTRSLGPAAPRNMILPDNRHYTNFGSEVGITSTPVIERMGRGGTMFIVAKTLENGQCHYTLHALNILNGKSKRTPVAIKASVVNASLKALEFSPRFNLNRPGLLLDNGVIYIAFGSHDDEGEFYGWILAHDAQDLTSLAAYNTAPDWGDGGVWQSGTGLAADEKGRIYAVVGNGAARDKSGMKAPAKVNDPVYGNAIIKLRYDKRKKVKERLVVEDWFTACNTFHLNDKDEDFIGGPVLIDAESNDGTPLKLVLGGGKDGKFYLTRRDQLGRWVKGRRNTNILQGDDRLCNYHIHGAPVVWRQEDGQVTAYVWSEKDFLKAFAFDGKRFGPHALSMSDYGLPHDENRMPGGVLTLGWDGKNDESAIVWAAHPTDSDAMNATVDGTLRAYDALDLNNELWTSDQDPNGDDKLGKLAKFCPPVVANGKVYMSTFSRELVVYGLFQDLGPGAGDPDREDNLGEFIMRNVGAADKIGSYVCSKYDLTITGTGGGIRGASDDFLLAYLNRNMKQGIQITARVNAINAPNFPDAIGGVIIRRDNSTQTERFAAVVISRRNEALFLHRDSAKATVKQDGPVAVTLPVYVRIEARNVDGQKGAVQFTGSISKDGVTWEVISSVTEIVMDAAPNMDVVAGLAVGSQQEPKPNNSVARSHVTFTHVEVT